MTEEDFIEILSDGAKRTQDFMAQLTEYHGGPIQTEYLLTSDLARAFLARHQTVTAEGLNKRICSPIASNRAKEAQSALAGKRSDIVIGDPLAARAIIEVKIRVKNYSGVSDDIEKIIGTLEYMNPAMKRRVLCAAVFQYHVGQTKRRWEQVHFSNAVELFEKSFELDLADARNRHSNYTLTLQSLMTQKMGGIVGQAVEEDFDGNPEWGQEGHATRYYAVLIKHATFGNPGPASFAQMKAEREL